MSHEQINPELKKRFKQLQLGVFTRKNSAFLAPLLCGLDIQFIIPEGAPKMFVMGCDSDTLYINPNRLLEISFKDASFILEHELWHIARMHNMRQGERDHSLWNQACDHVINLAMQKDGITCSIQGLADRKYEGMSEEEVYNKLYQKKLQMKANCNIDSNSPPKEVPPTEQSGMDFSQDLVPDNDQSKQTNQLANISKAKQQAQMSPTGLEPGSLAGNLVSMWEKVLAPKLPWEQVLHNLMKDLFPKSKLSWKRRNRRFIDIHLPSMVPSAKRLSHLIYCVDTSGSVDEDMLARINSEIKYIHDHIKPKLLTVMQFDHEIEHIDIIKDKDRYQNLKLHGGGGTDYEPIRRYINNLPKRPDGVVIFTDLYCYPMQPLDDESIPVFWVAVNTEADESAIKFGHYIKVEL